MEQAKYTALTNEQAYAVMMAQFELSDLNRRLAEDDPRSFWIAVTVVTSLCVVIMVLIMVGRVSAQGVFISAVLTAAVLFGTAWLVRLDDRREYKRAQKLERTLAALDNALT